MSDDFGESGENLIRYSQYIIFHLSFQTSSRDFSNSLNLSNVGEIYYNSINSSDTHELNRFLGQNFHKDNLKKLFSRGYVLH